MPQLTELYLGGNSIGTRGCEVLAAAFSATPTALSRLKRLHLFRNGITRRGAVALGYALHETWALTACLHVELAGNEVDERACRFLREALYRREYGRNVLQRWRAYSKRAIMNACEARLARTREVILPAMVQWRVNSTLDH